MYEIAITKKKVLRNHLQIYKSPCLINHNPWPNLYHDQLRAPGCLQYLQSFNLAPWGPAALNHRYWQFYCPSLVFVLFINTMHVSAKFLQFIFVISRDWQKERATSLFLIYFCAFFPSLALICTNLPYLP